MKFKLHCLGIFCCLCSCVLGTNIYVRPNVVNIGALFAFNSTIGRAAKVAIGAAVNDINNNSSILPVTELAVKMQDSNCNGFIGIVQALQFMEKDTFAIIGPQSSVIAHAIAHAANELQVPLMSFAATDPTLSALQYPFFVRTTHSDQFQMASVADLVEYYKWKLVTAIYIDDDYGRNGVSSLGDELAKRWSKISYKAAIRPGATKSEITTVLVKVAMLESRVLVLHANPDTGLTVFSLALSLGMTSDGYVWIATDWLSSSLDSALHLDNGLLSTMQGVLTLRQHTENTRRKNALASQWSALVRGDSGDIRENLHLEATSVFDGGNLLLEQIRRVNFMGATGPVEFDSDGNLIQPAYDILNIVGTGWRTIGYWSNHSGLSIVPPESLNKKPSNGANENKKLYTAIWLGETTTRPRGWVFSSNGNKNWNSRQAINLLQYPVPYKLIPFGSGSENPSYTQLINELTNEFDVVVGDISIVTNRTKVVDFTQPYVESGLVILTSVKKQSSNGWSLLQPFTIKMWCITGLFFLIIGTVVWMLEHRINDEFRGPPAKQIITVFWFSFSTLFFAHREDTRSALGRFVIIFWLFVVLIIQSSYTASLTSILTALHGLDHPVQLHCQPDLHTHHAAPGFSDHGHRQLDRQWRGGFQVGSFAESYLVHELGVARSRLRSLGSPNEYKNTLERGPHRGGVAAIVDERPYIELFLLQHDKFAIVGSEFTKAGWGFAFLRDSQLAADLSMAILELSENGDLQRIHDKWLSSRPSPSQSGDVLESERLHLHSFSGLFLICGVACLLALAVHACVLFRQYSRHVAAEQAAGSDRSSLRVFLSFADRRGRQLQRSFP